MSDKTITTLYHAKCEGILPTLDLSSCVVIADPPYELTNWTNPNAWDKALPLAILWPFLNKAKTIILFGNEPYSTYQRSTNAANFKYDLIWVKNKITGFPNAKVKPLKKFEKISVFSSQTTSPGRSNNMTYNPQGLIPCNKTVSNLKRSRSVISDRSSIGDSYQQTATGYPSDVLFFDTESGLHPTQKPVALLEYLIKTYSNAEDTIVDFCMGSGTTGVAARNAGRDFIGIESDEKYFRIAKERIAA